MNYKSTPRWMRFWRSIANDWLLKRSELTQLLAICNTAAECNMRAVEINETHTRTPEELLPRNTLTRILVAGIGIVAICLFAVLFARRSDAEHIFQTSLDTARAEGKRAMIIVPDAQHRKFVRDNSEILGKYFVVAEINPQMRHYQEVAGRFRKYGKGYLQYYGFTAILDADGTVLGTSGEMPDGPIGIPLTTNSRNRTRYLTLLAETAVGMTQAEVLSIDRAADCVTAEWPITK